MMDNILEPRITNSIEGRRADDIAAVCSGVDRRGYAPAPVGLNTFISTLPTSTTALAKPISQPPCHCGRWHMKRPFPLRASEPLRMPRPAPTWQRTRSSPPTPPPPHLFPFRETRLGYSPRAVAVAACPAPAYYDMVNRYSPGTIDNCATVCWTPPLPRPHRNRC